MKDLIIKCSSYIVEDAKYGGVEVELRNIKSIDGLNLKELYTDKYFDVDEMLEILDKKLIFERISIDEFIDQYGVDVIFKQIEDVIIERYIRKKKLEKLETGSK
jgi:hypothetical protein